MRKDRGVALAVTLILLSGLGALAMAAAAAAAAALSLSGHQQFVQRAFEAAEAGIAESLELAAMTRSSSAIPSSEFPTTGPILAHFEATTTADPAAGTLPVGFSVGENSGTFSARHFFIVSDGRAGRGARVRLEQGFYLVEPAP
jgi:Tfp pilus assembly protein PilX